MTRRFGILGRRGPRAAASRLVTHQPRVGGSSGSAYGKGMFTSQPRDPGWHSTGAPRINSLSSVRHMAFGGGKHQIIRGRNLQTIQRVFMMRVQAANPIVTELPILSQTSDGREMKVSVPDSAGINFGQGKRLFLTDMQPYTYEFGPGDIGASKLIRSSGAAGSSRRARRFKRVKPTRGLRRKSRKR